jgi:hypothetical protein
MTGAIGALAGVFSGELAGALADTLAGVLAGVIAGVIAGVEAGAVVRGGVSGLSSLSGLEALGFALPGLALPGFALPGFALPGFATAGFAAAGFAAVGFAVAGSWAATNRVWLLGTDFGHRERSAWAVIRSAANVSDTRSARRFMGCVGAVDESGRRHGMWLAEGYVLQPFRDRAFLWWERVPDLEPVA